MEARAIDNGKFGTVYRVDTPKGSRAIKIGTRNKGYGFQPDILNEIDTLRKFSSCPGIIKVYNFSCSNEEIYLEMELMPGKLSTWIHEEKSMTTRMKFLPSIMSQLGTSLNCLHSYGYVHNDLKTNNVLLRFNNDSVEVRLIDFGKSGHVSQVEEYSAIHSYCIPTSKWDNNIFVDEIFSFAICMIEIILGGKMFREEGSVNRFVARYSCQTGYNIRKYLRESLLRREFDLIPQIFFDVFEPIFNSKKNVGICNQIMNTYFPIDSYNTMVTLHKSLRLSPITEDKIISLFPHLEHDSPSIYKRCKNFCSVIEGMYLHRSLSSKEVEAACYFFLHGKDRKKKPKYHLSNKEILQSQNKLIDLCQCQIVYL